MPTGQRVPAETIDRWVQLHLGGLTSVQIAKQEGAPDSTVLQALQRRGAYVRRRTTSPRCTFRVTAPGDTPKARNRKRHLRALYGMTVEAYDEMAKAQEWCCAICRDPVVGPLHVDHDHATGCVRGLLCSNCNTALGKFKDDPKVLEAAIAYIARAADVK